MQLEMFWTRNPPLKGAELKRLCEKHVEKDDRGSWASSSVPILKRRLVAVELRQRQVVDDKIWEEDWELWQAISPYATLQGNQLQAAARKLGIQGHVVMEDTRQRHQAATAAATLDKMRDVRSLRRLVLQHVMRARNVDGGQLPVVQDETEKWRRQVLERILFAEDIGLLNCLTSPARIVVEVRHLLSWCGTDAMMVTTATEDLVGNSRMDWLDSLKAKFKAFEEGAFDEGDFEPVAKTVAGVKGAIKWEIGTLRAFPEMCSRLVPHFTGWL